MPLSYINLGSPEIVYLNALQTRDPNITESSTRTPFIIASFLVGLMTYFIVFNLDSLVFLAAKMYSGVCQACIEQMLTDSKEFPKGDPWQNRAQGFNQFEPDRGRTKPSEWYILWFFLMCYLLGRRLKPGKGTRSSGSSARGKGPEETVKETKWKRRMQTLFGRPGGVAEEDKTNSA